MKKLFFLYFILLTVNVIAQRSYPITTIFKGDTVVILTARQSQQINFLIDSLGKLNKKLEVENQNKDLLITNKNNLLKRKKISYDSLRLEIDSIKSKVGRFAKLDSFKNEVLDLAKLGVILYQRDNGEFFYINLRSYHWTIWGNDKIVLRPIKDETKWGVVRIWGLPQSDNLSLHLWPHKYTGDKLKIQKKW